MAGTAARIVAASGRRTNDMISPGGTLKYRGRSVVCHPNETHLCLRFAARRHMVGLPPSPSRPPINRSHMRRTLGSTALLVSLAAGIAGAQGSQPQKKPAAPSRAAAKTIAWADLVGEWVGKSTRGTSDSV